MSPDYSQCAGQSGNETTRRAAYELLIYAYYNKSVWALMCMATVRVQLKDEGRSRLASLCLPPAAMLELTAAPGRQGGVAARVGASDRCRPAAVGGTLCLVSESSLSKNEKHF